MKLFGKHLTPSAAIGLAIIALNVAIVILVPWIAPFGEAELVGDVWAAPTSASWLGNDNLGRDLLTRVLYGGRNSVVLALAITLLAFAIGMTFGFLAAVSPRWVDMILSRIVDLMMSIPTLILALVILSVVGTSIPTLIVIVAVLEATRVFRVSRAVAMDIAVLEYVEIARLRGEGLWWIMSREVLPNSWPPMIAEFGLRFCYSLLFVASLSFLGLGIQPPSADWGSMVKENATAIYVGGIAPLVPAAALAVLTVGVNLVMDWFLSIQQRPHGDRA